VLEGRNLSFRESGIEPKLVTFNTEWFQAPFYSEAQLRCDPIYAAID
jgi:hypothetical protein